MDLEAAHLHLQPRRRAGALSLLPPFFLSSSASTQTNQHHFIGQHGGKWCLPCPVQPPHILLVGVPQSVFVAVHDVVTHKLSSGSPSACTVRTDQRTRKLYLLGMRSHCFEPFPPKHSLFSGRGSMLFIIEDKVKLTMWMCVLFHHCFCISTTLHSA